MRLLPRRLLTTLRRPLRSARRGARPGALVLGYEPHPDQDADPGEVVWTWVAYEENPAQGKDRPVVVIGRYPDGRVGGLMLTSREHQGDPDYHRIGSGPWDRLGRPSWAKLDRLLTMRADGLRREGGRLDRERYDALVAAWSETARR